MAEPEANEVKILIMCYWRFVRQHPIVATEVDSYLDVPWRGGSQADVLSLTPSGLVVETEIKVSLPDLKRDVKKPKHWFWGDGRRPSHYSAHYFYFAVPHTLEEKAREVIAQDYPYAGLLVAQDPCSHPQGWTRDYFDPMVRAARPAKRLKEATKLDPDQVLKLAKGMSATVCRLAFKQMRKKVDWPLASVVEELLKSPLEWG